MPDDEILRYAPPEDVIRLAKENGFTDQQIARILTGGLTYREARDRAKQYAPLLQITVGEFMRLRSNR